MLVLQMKTKIGNGNKIKNSNVGKNNKIESEQTPNKFLIDILVGLFITIVGGIILYFIIN